MARTFLEPSGPISKWIMETLLPTTWDQEWEERSKIAKQNEILLRTFSPISGYEPDPKREEWQDEADCWQCPYWVSGEHNDETGQRQLGECLLRYFSRDIHRRKLPLGDPSFCRFSEYRRILFRSFEVTK